MLIFNELLHQPVRSKLMVALMKNEKIPFKVLKQMLDLSSGNLSTHLRKLEDAGYVIIEKYFENKKPKTEISISELGKKDFKEYAKEINELQGRAFLLNTKLFRFAKKWSILVVFFFMVNDLKGRGIIPTLD